MQSREQLQQQSGKQSEKDIEITEGLVNRGQELIHKLSDSIQHISSSISHTAHDLLAKVWHEYPNPEKDLDPKIKLNVKKINEEMIHRPHGAERVIESMGKGGEEGEKHSLLQRAKEGIHELHDKFVHEVENLEKKFQHKPEGKENAEKGPSFIEKTKERISEFGSKIAGSFEPKTETEVTEGRFVDLAPTHHVNPTELKQFHEVKTGFSETVSEFQHEKRLEEVGQETIASNNPFEVLGKEELTEESKPFTEKISETTSRIASRITETKDKIISTLTSHPNENVTSP